jgi:NAD(P)-dependent dehydrogenase (short-subunit alcohol dehydrogenase family)
MLSIFAITLKVSASGLFRLDVSGWKRDFQGCFTEKADQRDLKRQLLVLNNTDLRNENITLFVIQVPQFIGLFPCFSVNCGYLPCRLRKIHGMNVAVPDADLTKCQKTALAGYHIILRCDMGDIRYDDRVAVITGAGGGLGRSYAIYLAERGAKVVVNDLGGSTDGQGNDSKAADAVVEEIRAAGGEATANYDSVSDAAGGANIIKTAVDAYGKVDIVINNAGILRDGSMAKMTSGNFDALIDVHLKGAFYVTQPAFKIMKENGYGRVVYTASGAGVFGNFGQANYAAAKMGLVGLSSVTAIEGAKYNIRSNVITPIARTRLTEDVMGATGDMFAPEFIAPMVAYLVSEECELTHEIFNVGAGRYSRIFVGSAPGWNAEQGTTPSVEDVRDNLEAIRSTDNYKIPTNAAEA